MILRIGFGVLLLSLSISVGCVDRDPSIGLVLFYRSSHPTQIVLLELDGQRIIDDRTLSMYVGPGGKQEALLMPRGSTPAPKEVTAIWRYQTTDPADQTLLNVPFDAIRWHEAHATVALRSTMTAEALGLLQESPEKHRLRLNVIFNDDRLDVGWEVQRR